jgi:hypothetical protein
MAGTRRKPEPEPTTELVEFKPIERVLQLPIGLLVSTGAPKPERGPGRPLDHFRFKPGDLDQYADAAAKANEVYGDKPKELDDILLLSNDLRELLDIRVKAYGKSGVRIIGKTNFATLPEDEYVERVDAWDDEILYFPRELKEVPARMRETWEGESIPSKLEGPEDPRIEKFQMRIEATFRFGLPRVLGLGKVALYSTGAKNNRDKLRKSLLFSHEAFRGNLIGVRFRLAIRPRKSSYYEPSTADPSKRGWRPTQVYEVILDTPWTLQEAIDSLEQQREKLGSGQMLKELVAGGTGSAFFADDAERQRAETEAAIIASVSNLPTVDDRESHVREEPAATGPGEAVLNRIAALEKEAGPQARAFLRGVFGVDDASELAPEDAERYESGLREFVGDTEVVDAADVVATDADGNEIPF